MHESGPGAHVKSYNLVFKAGPAAFDSVRRHGFAPERIGTLVGASGGAKWLVLSQLDRVILETIVPRLVGPVHLVSSSIGAWRFSCYARRDPLAAIDRFEDAYIEQSYSDAPDIQEITAKSREILRAVLGDNGVEEILDHPFFRTHVMTVRSRHVGSSDNPLLLGAVLLGAASCNALSRASLGWFFERALFYDARELPPFFGIRGFPVQRVSMGPDNLEDVIAATGAIPLVLSGVRNIARASSGTYRDGGIIDYHLDLPHSDQDRLSLYPHFFDRIVPGWFDKRLAWRQASAVNIDRTILVCPSPEFVAKLPQAKIPDRTDFRRYAPGKRVEVWRAVVRECQALADELHEVLEKGQLESRLTGF
jgi:hypothetical protein